jgi:hypothetical protein
VLSLRILLVAAGITLALSACSFDQILGKGGSEAAPSAASGTDGTGASGTAAASSVSRERAGKAATKALGAQVVAKSGQYLLCRLTDEYKGRTTYYYTCRERQCVGQESAATDVKTPKTKAGCMSTCRSLEAKAKGARSASNKSYCAS